MARIFVTGGTGFVGRHLLKSLLDNGDFRILALSGRSNLDPELKESSNLVFVRGDLADAEWQKEVDRFKPDVAIHLAWEGIPDFSSAMCLKNLKYGQDLFQFLYGIGCKTIITAGSCWEYGKATGLIDEDQPVVPANAFVAAKDAFHNLGCELAKEYSQSFIWLRLFYVYGPGQKKTSLVPHLINCLKTGENPQINNINIAHDFIYVEDVAEAIAMIANHQWTSGRHIFNIGSGHLIKVQDIANFILEGREDFADDGRGFYANLSRIKSEVGWQPKTTIVAGLTKTKNYFLSP